jgi:hypothetical protein
MTGEGAAADGAADEQEAADPGTVTVDRRPSRAGTGLALLPALVAALAGGLYTWPGLLVGLVGLLGLAAGLTRGSRTAVTLGAAGLFAGALLAGAEGAPVGPVLVGAAAAVVAWDVATTAVSVGEQLGRAAETRRLEATRALASAGVGVVTVSLSYGVYLAGAGGRPVAALLFLLVAAVLLVAALD